MLTNFIENYKRNQKGVVSHLTIGLALVVIFLILVLFGPGIGGRLGFLGQLKEKEESFAQHGEIEPGVLARYISCLAREHSIERCKQALASPSPSPSPSAPTTSAVGNKYHWYGKWCDTAKTEKWFEDWINQRQEGAGGRRRSADGLRTGSNKGLASHPGDIRFWSEHLGIGLRPQDREHLHNICNGPNLYSSNLPPLPKPKLPNLVRIHDFPPVYASISKDNHPRDSKVYVSWMTVLRTGSATVRLPNGKLGIAFQLDYPEWQSVDPAVIRALWEASDATARALELVRRGYSSDSFRGEWGAMKYIDQAGMPRSWLPDWVACFSGTQWPPYPGWSNSSSVTPPVAFRGIPCRLPQAAIDWKEGRTPTVNISPQ